MKADMDDSSDDGGDFLKPSPSKTTKSTDGAVKRILPDQLPDVDETTLPKPKPVFHKARKPDAAKKKERLQHHSDHKC